MVEKHRGRPTVAAATGAALMVLSAACGNPQAPPTSMEDARTTGTDGVRTTSPPPPSPDPTPTSAPAAIRDLSFEHKSGDGTTITVDLRLSEVIPVSQDERIWATIRELDGPGTDLRSGPCQSSGPDGARDATVLGTVAFTNNTPDYPVDSLTLMFTSSPLLAPGPTGFGVRYSDEERCYELGSAISPGQVNPKMDDGAWGPAPIAFYITGLYGPDYPDGNPELLEELAVNASVIVNSAPELNLHTIDLVE